MRPAVAAIERRSAARVVLAQFSWWTVFADSGQAEVCVGSLNRGRSRTHGP